MMYYVHIWVPASAPHPQHGKRVDGTYFELVVHADDYEAAKAKALREFWRGEIRMCSPAPEVIIVKSWLTEG